MFWKDSLLARTQDNVLRTRDGAEGNGGPYFDHQSCNAVQRHLGLGRSS